MLFKLDENLPGALAGLFTEAGHDAVTVSEQEMAGASDPRIASVCRRERRALLTLDMDFAAIRTYPPQDYPGLVVFRLSRHGPGLVLKTNIPRFNRSSGAMEIWYHDLTNLGRLMLEEIGLGDEEDYE